MIDFRFIAGVVLINSLVLMGINSMWIYAYSFVLQKKTYYKITERDFKKNVTRETTVRGPMVRQTFEGTIEIQEIE